MKLKKEKTEQREKYAVNLFKEDLALSIPKANDMVHKQFGSMVRNQRMYELRAIARGEAKAPKAPAGAILQASRPGEKKPPTGIAFIELKSKDQGAFLTDTMRDLRDAGLSNLGVVHVTSTYAIVAEVRPT